MIKSDSAGLTASQLVQWLSITATLTCHNNHEHSTADHLQRHVGPRVENGFHPRWKRDPENRCRHPWPRSTRQNDLQSYRWRFFAKTFSDPGLSTSGNP